MKQQKKEPDFQVEFHKLPDNLDVDEDGRFLGFKNHFTKVVTALIVATLFTVLAAVAANASVGSAQSILSKSVFQDDSLSLPALVHKLEASSSAALPATPKKEHIATPQGVDYGYVKLPKNWGDLLPAKAKPYLELIDSAGRRANVDPRLLAALIRTESNFNHINPIGPGGISISFLDNGKLGHAIGLTQLLKSTARGQKVNPYNNADNAFGGAKYLRHLLNEFNQGLWISLSAYNGGPNNPYGAATGYADGIIAHYRSYGGKTQ